MHVSMHALLAYAPLLALVFVSAVTDVRQRRIPNWVTATVALAGIAQSLTPFAVTTLNQAIGGLLVGFLLPFLMYAVGGRGAGDVKLLAGIGAWLGVWPVVWVFAAAAVLSLLVAIVQSAIQGKLTALLSNTAMMLLALLNVRHLGKAHVIGTGKSCQSIAKPMPNSLHVLLATIAVLVWVVGIK